MPNRPPLGAHVSAAGGMATAFERADQYGAEVIQVFTGNPRQHALRRFTQEELSQYREERALHGNPIVMSHASYLINLASPKENVRLNSRKALEAELNRCALLDIDRVVLHVGSGLDGSREESMSHVVDGLQEVIAAADGTTVVLLETSAGQGASVGDRFEDLARLLARLEPSARFGVCFDTCHVFAAGYDLRGDGYDATWKAFDQTVGIDRVMAIHLNDSKCDLGGRVDRHEHPGEGSLGIEPFRRVVNDSRLRHVPCFIETPDDLQYHARNLATLKSLADPGDEPKSADPA